jgi:hypothetical protein
MELSDLLTAIREEAEALRKTSTLPITCGDLANSFDAIEQRVLQLDALDQE